MDRFRDKADEGIDKAREQADERTGGRFREQTERLADAARQRLGGGQTDETDETDEDERGQARHTQDTEPLGMDADEEELDETGPPAGDRMHSYRDERGL